MIYNNNNNNSDNDNSYNRKNLPPFAYSLQVVKKSNKSFLFFVFFFFIICEICASQQIWLLVEFSLRLIVGGEEEV